MLSTNTGIQESFQQWHRFFWPYPFHSSLNIAEFCLNPVHQHSQLTLIYLPESPINSPKGMAEKIWSLTQGPLNWFNSLSYLARSVFDLVLVEQGNPTDNVQSDKSGLLIFVMLNVSIHYRYVNIPNK